MTHHTWAEAVAGIHHKRWSKWTRSHPERCWVEERLNHWSWATLCFMRAWPNCVGIWYITYATSCSSFVCPLLPFPDVLTNCTMTFTHFKQPRHVLIGKSYGPEIIKDLGVQYSSHSLNFTRFLASLLQCDACPCLWVYYIEHPISKKAMSDLQ